MVDKDFTSFRAEVLNFILLELNWFSWAVTAHWREKIRVRTKQLQIMATQGKKTGRRPRLPVCKLFSSALSKLFANRLPCGVARHNRIPVHRPPIPRNSQPLYMCALPPGAFPPDPNDVYAARQLTFQQAVDDRVKINFCG